MSDSVTPRRFGLTLGPALLALGALLWWSGRSRPTPVADVTMAVGAALLLCALVAPRGLAPVERAWMTLGHRMGRITTPVIFSVLWLVVFVPMGILRRTFGRSPLARRADASTYWGRRAPTTPELARAAMERQF